MDDLNPCFVSARRIVGSVATQFAVLSQPLLPRCIRYDAQLSERCALPVGGDYCSFEVFPLNHSGVCQSDCYFTLNHEIHKVGRFSNSANHVQRIAFFDGSVESNEHFLFERQFIFVAAEDSVSSESQDKIANIVGRPLHGFESARYQQFLISEINLPRSGKAQK